jgi:SAM-dependent methyltransferase
MSSAGPGPCVLCGGVRRRRLFAKRGWDFLGCADCGLVSIDPMPGPEELARHHERSYASGAYAVFAAAERIRTAIARHRLAAVRPLAPAGPWLDVGCATGAFLAAAAAAGIEGEGLELAADAAERARARGLRVRCTTAEAFVPSRRYAAVTAFDVLEHLPDPAALVERLAGWLLPGGVVAVTVPNLESVSARLMGRRWYYHAPPDHVHGFTPATLGRLLARGGLDEIAIRPAAKPMTLDYATLALAQFEPRLGTAARAAVRLLPRAVREALLPVRVGEVLATARAPRA